jgi:translation initiation factor 6
MIRMTIERTRIHGNDYVGAWSIATDEFFIVGNDIKRRTEEIARDALDVDVFRASVGGSALIGIYVAANSNGILLPNLTERREAEHLRHELQGTRVEVLETDLNALKNNILANDKIAIINPNFSRAEERRIADVLGVETVRLGIAGFHTVGANNILTNKGFVLNNRASDEEKDKIEGILGVKVEQSTANTGSVNIGLCVVANSNGMIAGEATTGYELARIAESLELD